jgi:hypothetical protein
MPSDDGLRLDDFERVQHIGSQPIERGKHEAIEVADSHPLWRSTPQYVELMSKDEDFGLQRGARPEQSDCGAPDQPEEIAHRNHYRPIRWAPSAVLGFR